MSYTILWHIGAYFQHKVCGVTRLAQYLLIGMQDYFIQHLFCQVLYLITLIIDVLNYYCETQFFFHFYENDESFIQNWLFQNFVS